MKSRFKVMRTVWLGMVMVLGLFFICSTLSGSWAVTDTKAESKITEGILQTTDKNGKVLTFPLKHTAVYSEISGFIAQVEVKQYFTNPYNKKIEAVYTFPLPENAAVNEMIMVVGKRNVYGEIHKREEARRIYTEAKSQGKRTALLEQERPNIFTQSVANIQPGEEIIITIRYVQVLKYDRGVYRYSFPMVVGPRYIPGESDGSKQGQGWAPDTNLVPDASRITPPVLKPGRRSGHDISLTVKLNAGLPVNNLHSISHDVEIVYGKEGEALIAIKPYDSIPNKDFVLEYGVAGEKPRFSYLTHAAQQGGYLMLMLQPSYNSVTRDVKPKEIYFVVDTSGSMSGYPIMKVKEAMYHCVQGLSADDTFQIIRFDDKASSFAPKPVEATYLHKEEALDFIIALEGSGGTEMIEGIKACLDAPKTAGRQRIVFFMTDGYIGNETRILQAIREKVGDTRLFSFGVGSSTNTYLLENMATAGNGTAQYIRQDQLSEPIIRAMLERISKPYLSDVNIKWGGLDIYEVSPQPLPNLYSAQPLIVFARYKNGGEGWVTLRGKINGQDYSEKIKVTLPKWNTNNSSLPVVWAREKIKDLMFAQLLAQAGNTNLAEEITKLALEYNLMSQYTSFVAVDEVLPESGDTSLPETVYIPVPMPEGVSFTGVFGPAAFYEGDFVKNLIRFDEDQEECNGAVNDSGRKYKSSGYSGVYSAPTVQLQLNKMSVGSSSYSTCGECDYMGNVGRTDFMPKITSKSRDAAFDKFLSDSFKELTEKDTECAKALKQLYYGDAKSIDAKQANAELKKLINSSNDGKKMVALNFMGMLVAKDVKIDRDLTQAAVRLVLSSQNQYIRGQALLVAYVLKEAGDLNLLEKTAHDSYSLVRALTAYLLQEATLDAKVEQLLIKLAADSDPATAAAAAKCGTEAHKITALIPVLSKIVLNSDAHKNYLAIYEAAVGLSRLAQAVPAKKAQIQEVFANVVKKDYPEKVGSENLNLKRSLNLLALKNLVGYRGSSAYPYIKKIAETDRDNEVRMLALYVVAAYGRSETLDLARKILRDGTYSDKSFADLRIALVEVMFDLGQKGDVDCAIALLKKDTAWKVRRAILAEVLRHQKGRVLEVALEAMDDPHPVVRQLAVTAAVAATAQKSKREAAFSKITKSPTPAACIELLEAEKLGSDFSLRSIDDIKKVINKRKAG